MSEYDKIADRYDGLFKDPASLAENEEVEKMIALQRGEFVYDIGCGTGLFVEITKIAPARYIGVDPSRKMLEHFRRKFPDFRDHLLNAYFGEATAMPAADLIVSLFGAPSYLPENALRRIARSSSRLFLMFYRQDYHPVTYEKCGVEFSHYLYGHGALEDIFGAGTYREWHNYIIIEREKFKRI